MPYTWWIACNGSMDADRYLHRQIARAICLAAYEQPVTVEGISQATGIPGYLFSSESIRNALKYSPEATRQRFLRSMKAAQSARRD